MYIYIYIYIYNMLISLPPHTRHRSLTQNKVNQNRALNGF